MINKNELRAGNKVNYMGMPNGKPITVDIVEIYKYSVLYDFSDYGTTPYSDLQGIPLTPEWLERCGFEWYSNIHRWRHKETGYLVIQSASGFDSGYGDGSIKKAPLQYVHQLQNIHLDLTGIEITLKETV